MEVAQLLVYTSNAMALLTDLLAKGYFPKELPPSFSSQGFTSRIQATFAALPHGFDDPPPARLCSYSLPKAGGLRRRLAIPNPVPHFPFCALLDAKWPNLQHHLTSSGFSLSTPVADPRGMRALVPRLHFEDLPAMRAKNRSASRYAVTTDLSEFYNSIYTHSVPWALHGKATAKANRRNLALFGNRLDMLLGTAQDSQTIGVPIGPDTSLVIAEIILSAVDDELARRIPTLKGIRYIDDFEFCFGDHSSAERALATLQEILLEYELRLNPRKTKVDQSPIRFEQEWIYTLRDFRFSSSPKGQLRDLLGYFDSVTHLHKALPQDHIVKYALARLRGFQVDPSNWEVFQSLLASAVMTEAGAIQPYLDVLISCQNAGHGVDRGLTESTLNHAIVACAPLGHHHEVVWSLWGIIFFGLGINAEAARAVSEVDNSFVALLALDANRLGLVTGALNTSTWQSRMTTSELYDDQWLLAYEANVKGWLPSVGGGDHVARDACFNFLKTLGVEFYASPAGVPATVPIGLTYP